MIDTQRENIQQLLEMLIRPSGNTPIQHALLYWQEGSVGAPLVLTAGNLSREQAIDGIRLRTGSMTKPFTAALILQLVEAGRLRLGDGLLDLMGESDRDLVEPLLYIDGVNFTEEITVAHLLRHRSGLRDYFSDDERFVEELFRDPDRQWDWRSVMETYYRFELHRPGIGRPGDLFHYADTNYLLLARLAEVCTGRTYAELLTERIILPLGLTNTYLEFYQEALTDREMVYPHYGPHSLEKVNTSFDWGGGGLVATPRDLDTFFRALLAGKLFQDKSTLEYLPGFRDMPTADSDRRAIYGLGLQQKQFGDLQMIGHNSAYGAMYYYAPERDLSIFLSVNQAAAMHKAEWLLDRVMKTYLAG
ncbi:serine hydrolase domain-containing protein [Flavilitoribacter nigricans]|uniref:D-alanyl-D-alanine carboxypeptidase n=1 Tax=Flavilitoribacter nigricans (strain ATCC 23147 / DSM 23189 / NBRC 102662 / NCIMB 1420 / SS-2) TaxID=1122177 RepID=A0A2D0N248_FLAN2|nr:serine hydrolase domain-containing protein [Flavilitoribacter nigricans]PHN02490.1 D-alanyl-D-alanine carboxypeptidase [Flavilitoribacter nigricans DSM 23189 = NBRC 102662]